MFNFVILPAPTKLIFKRGWFSPCRPVVGSGSRDGSRLDQVRGVRAACERASVRACVRACVRRACVRAGGQVGGRAGGWSGSRVGSRLDQVRGEWPAKPPQLPKNSQLEGAFERIIRRTAGEAAAAAKKTDSWRATQELGCPGTWMPRSSGAQVSKVHTVTSISLKIPL